MGDDLLFQIISERAERAAVIIKTNLPFAGWTQAFTDPRLCKALLERLTDRAYIIETCRFRRTPEDRKRRK